MQKRANRILNSVIYQKSCIFGKNQLPHRLPKFSLQVKAYHSKNAGGPALRPCWNCSHRPKIAPSGNAGIENINSKNTNHPLQCLKCQAPLELPPRSFTYFHAFNMSIPSFKVPYSQAQLKLFYYQLQKTLHPDKQNFSIKKSLTKNKSFDELKKTWSKHAEDATAWINQAYKTVSDPLARALYLLELKGEEIDESSTLDISMNADEEERMEFLSDWLDTREQLESLPVDSEQRHVLCSENQDKLIKLIHEMENSFENVDFSAFDLSDGSEQPSRLKTDDQISLKTSKELTIRLRYLKKLSDICHQSF